jgi:hypothetical protein
MESAREALDAAPWSWSRRFRNIDAAIRDFDSLVVRLKNLVEKIPTKRSGGSPRIRNDKKRKELCTRGAVVGHKVEISAAAGGHDLSLSWPLPRVDFLGDKGRYHQGDEARTGGTRRRFCIPEPCCGMLAT